MGEILIAAGTAVGAYGQYQQGQALAAQAESQQAMADYNAKVQEREAKAALVRAQYEQVRQAEAGERTKSSLQAFLATTGTVPAAGTSLLVQAEQAAELELENLMIGYEGLTGEARARSQAEIDRMQGKIYKQRARSYRTAGYIGAGRELLTGFGGKFE